MSISTICNWVGRITLSLYIKKELQNVNKRCYFITITGLLQGIGEDKKGCFTHKKENNKNKQDK